tara:strand:- start:323 stop:451 length:129 start_codon:yes stop_codon:yes gene_type:complete
MEELQELQELQALRKEVTEDVRFRELAVERRAGLEKQDVLIG